MGLNPRSTVLPQQCPLSKTENCLKANNLKKETFFISAKTLLMGWNYKMTIKRNYFFWTPNSFSLGWRTGSIHVVLHYVSPSAGQPKLTWKSSTTFFSPLISTVLASPMRAVGVTEPLTDKLMSTYQTNGQLGLDWKLPEDPKWAGAADRPPRSTAFRRHVGINGPAGTSSSSTTGNPAPGKEQPDAPVQFWRLITKN